MEKGWYNSYTVNILVGDNTYAKAVPITQCK